MRNWDEDDDGYCTAAADLQDARRVCESLDLPLHTVNFSARVPRTRVRAFPRRTARRAHAEPGRRLQSRDQVRRVLRARAPPRCRSGSRPATTRGRRSVDGRPRLLRAADRDKDQTLFPARGARARCSRARSSRSATSTRRRCGASPTSERCRCTTSATAPASASSASGRSRSSWPLTCRPGPGRSRPRTAASLGEHRGLMYYTLGPAPGPRCSAACGAPRRRPGTSSRKDLARNVLVVTQGHDDPGLMSREFETESVALDRRAIRRRDEFACTVKTRYRQRDQACTVERAGRRRLPRRDRAARSGPSPRASRPCSTTARTASAAA